MRGTIIPGRKLITTIRRNKAITIIPNVIITHRNPNIMVITSVPTIADMEISMVIAEAIGMAIPDIAISVVTAMTTKRCYRLHELAQVKTGNELSISLQGQMDGIDIQMLCDAIGKVLNGLFAISAIRIASISGIDGFKVVTSKLVIVKNTMNMSA